MFNFNDLKTFLKTSGYGIESEVATEITLKHDDFYIHAKEIDDKMCIWVSNNKSMPRFLVGETPSMPYVERANMTFMYGGGYIEVTDKIHTNYNNNIFMITTERGRMAYNLIFGKMDSFNPDMTTGLFIAGNTFFSLDNGILRTKVFNNKLEYMANTSVDTYDEYMRYFTKWGMTYSLRELFAGIDDNTNTAVLTSSMEYRNIPLPTYRNIMWTSSKKYSSEWEEYTQPSYEQEIADIAYRHKQAPTIKYSGEIIWENENTDKGLTVSCNTGKSMVLPIHLFVKAEPTRENYYRHFGTLETASYVNMYNMSTGAEFDGYQYFAVSTRSAKPEGRALTDEEKYGFHNMRKLAQVYVGNLIGYQGIAFKKG